MSTIVTDTITGKSTATTITIGSTPVVSASANSMTIRGEGSNQTSIQQGLAKCWNNFKGDGTAAINDSFNMASLTDNGSGDYTTTFTNGFNNATYSFSGVPLYLGSRVYVYGSSGALTAYATGSFRMKVAYVSATDGSGTHDDPRTCNMNFHGDLA